MSLLPSLLGSAVARRSLLLSSASLGLSFALPALSARAAWSRGSERPRSLLVVWLAGGPSQLETFDPHPGSPSGGPTKAIDTVVPDVQIAADYPGIAAVLDRFALVRSLVSKEGDHERGQYTVKTGYRPEPTIIHPAIGAIAAHELPSPGLQIPRFIALGAAEFPSRGGYLGAEFDPYRVFDSGHKGQNLVPHVDAERQTRRLAALATLTRSFESGRAGAVRRTFHEHTLREALTLMSSDQLAAFDLDDESESVKAFYGESDFGRGCLVARRLIEAGVRSVEITLQGFDTHARNFAGHTAQAQILDPALSALIGDLEDRDLLASTVVLVMGEFGRTPAINPLDGRDHWPHGFSCLLGGAGIAAGQVIGSTDPDGLSKMPSDPVEIADLTATVFRALGIDFAREVATPIGRPMKLSGGKPLARLLADAV
ncbi:MAG: DUF1501 domain-containing protein [Planctomycetota bacterium]|nr:MAG: DUF1501 domain-containing protein [Planctomycetota bacterium]